MNNDFSHSNKRRVVITGIGAVTPLGLTADESWQAVRNGVCGVAPITLFDNTDMKVTLAAEVKDFHAENYMPKAEAKRMGRFTQFAVVAAREAVNNAGLQTDSPDLDLDRCGVILSSGIGGQSITESEHVRGMQRGWDKVSPYYIPTAISNMAAGQIAIEHGFRGMCTCPVTACAGGTNAVGDAFHYIRDGYADVMLCGGTEAAITPLAIGGFTSMKALSQSTDPNRASIPFDKERSGFVMGEGAGVLLLEELSHAQERGATILAEMVGYGATCDAYHMTAPRPDGSGGAKAMTVALADGGVHPTEIDYINAHGTSTHLNDAGETAAVKLVFGDHAKNLAISSTKSMTGHMLGAAGAVEAIFTALALRDNYMPATIHYEVPDEECDLDVVPNVGRSVEMRYAMSNSLGFGGHNGSLLLKKWEE
jgi:3-oxoacyl-[acyl-carrier-protein] synthase II